MWELCGSTPPWAGGGGAGVDYDYEDDDEHEHDFSGQHENIKEQP